MLKRFLGATVLCTVALGCALFDSGTPWKDGRYALQWIDDPKEVTLSFELGKGAWGLLIESQVFAVGSNPDYIVAKQHPGGDKSKTYFYVVGRITDSSPISKPNSLVGPISSSEFDKMSKELALPNFSKTLGSLE